MSEPKTWVYKEGEDPKVIPLLELGEYVNDGWQNRPIKKLTEPVKPKRTRRKKSVKADNGDSTNIH